MKISQLISKGEIKKWKNGNVITITAGTGKGKSYFIKNNLYYYAKEKDEKILMLIHRVNCVEQFKREIKKDKKDDIIDIITYQTLENKDFNLNKYTYIICDEFHYFMSDAAFNKITDISFDKIIKSKNNIKIFMSATGNHMKKYLNNKKKINTIDYKLKISYRFIKSLYFFNKNQTLENLIEECIEKNQKAIVFIDSAERVYKIYTKFKDHSIFNCSKYNNKYYKKVDKNIIDDILEKERFEKNILITTTCMDAGVNIIDKDVKHIILDVKDIGSLIQCIGRRRILNNKDKINVYIKNLHNKQLGGIKSRLENKIRQADYLQKHNVKEYVQKFGRNTDYNNIVYDDIIKKPQPEITKKINELMYFKAKTDIWDISLMLKSHSKYGYNVYLSKKFGIKKYRILEEQDKKENLEEYLDSIVGKKLFKDEQDQLKEVFKSNGLNARTMGINTLNGNLKDRNMNYILTIGKRSTYRDKSGLIKKEKSHWKLGKLTF